MAIKGELTTEEYPQAEVYKWVAKFETEDGESFEAFAETKDEALIRLSLKIGSKHKLDD